MTSPAPAALRDIVVIGGGCYGSFYAGQLALARVRGKITFREVIVVDRNPSCQAVRENLLPADFSLAAEDWDPFLDRFLDRGPPPPTDPDDAIVPSPLMPHLMAHWLARLAQRRWPGRVAEAVPVSEPLGTPYDVLAPDGTRYVGMFDVAEVRAAREQLAAAVERGAALVMATVSSCHGAVGMLRVTGPGPGS